MLLTKEITLRTSIEINAPVAKVWKALTDPALVKQYFFGTEISSDWKKGSPIHYTGIWEGKEYHDKGIITEIEEEKFIRYNYWSSFSGKQDIPENYDKISYELSVRDEKTLLTVVQEGFKSDEEKEKSEKNWQMVFQGMKKLLEQ